MENVRDVLADADASRAAFVQGIRTPSWFFTSMGVAIAVQIATTALSLGLGQGLPWPLLAGLAFFVVVAGAQLARFRQGNGVWLGRFASRVVLGSGAAASGSYAVAMALATWAAYDDREALAVLCAIAGGAAYGISGRRWMAAYRADPARHGAGESPAWLAAIAIAAVAGLVVLALSR